MTHTAATRLSPWEIITGDAATVALVFAVAVAPLVAAGYYSKARA